MRGCDITNINTNLFVYRLQYFLKIPFCAYLGGRHGHSNPLIRVPQGQDPRIRDKIVSHPRGIPAPTQQR
jgi:hypothetical protein